MGGSFTGGKAGAPVRGAPFGERCRTGTRSNVNGTDPPRKSLLNSLVRPISTDAAESTREEDGSTSLTLTYILSGEAE